MRIIRWRPHLETKKFLLHSTKPCILIVPFFSLEGIKRCSIKVFEPESIREKYWLSRICTCHALKQRTIPCYGVSQKLSQKSPECANIDKIICVLCKICQPLLPLLFFRVLFKRSCKPPQKGIKRPLARSKKSMFLYRTI
jgi:hypothetical protein